MKSLDRMPAIPTPGAHHDPRLCRAMAFRLPHSGTGSAAPTWIDIGANIPFTCVSAYCLPVYAPQRPLPGTTQDSVRGCWLGFTTVAIPGHRTSCAFQGAIPLISRRKQEGGFSSGIDPEPTLVMLDAYQKECQPRRDLCAQKKWILHTRCQDAGPGRRDVSSSDGRHKHAVDFHRLSYIL